MAAENSCTTSMTWEELENCTELNRSRSGNGTLIKIETGTAQRNPEKARSIVSRSQQVQILKRQPKSDPCLTTSVTEKVTTSTSVLDGTTTMAAVANRPRTLEEREAAYAEARARILGSSGASLPPSPANSQGNTKKKFSNNGTNYRKGASSENSNQRGNKSSQQQPAENQFNFRSTNQNYRASDAANSSYRVLT